MKRLLLAAAMLGALALPAKADVILDTNLSGTGDNVVFNSFSGNLVTGSFNGQHSGFVHFTDLSGNANFSGAANGNDIKIVNTSDLSIVVFGTDNTTVLPTSTDVFSVVGTGTLTIKATATDGLFTFTEVLGSGQNGFTLTATNGEVITGFEVIDTGGVITDFEHYRVDVANVPGPIVGAGLPGLLAACCGMFGLNRYRRKRQVA
jgi:hypothetical protein